jgi:ribonuclease E
MSDSSGSEASQSQRPSSEGGGNNNRNRNRNRNRGGQNRDSQQNGPKVGDSRPARSDGGDSSDSNDQGGAQADGRNQGRSDQKRSGQGIGNQANNNQGNNSQGDRNGGDDSSEAKRGRRRGGRGRGRGRKPEEMVGVELDEATMAKRRGKERDGRPIGRYLMAVHVHNDTRHIAILEGRTLIEYYVSRPTDDVNQIHGNVYMGRVQNVLPGMEAAFIEISTPKNAVLYRGDVQYDPKEFEGNRGIPRIEQMLKAKQMILCQVVKNPIAHKGARLTQEVSLPGRFVVLVPNSDTYGISKRLPDPERKRLRKILDGIKPKQHGVIVRTAAADVTKEELERDVARLLNQWEVIVEDSKKQGGPRLLNREPDLAVRLIREEFTKDFRGVVLDDRTLFEEVSGYMDAVTPALADRVEHYDPVSEGIDLFERHHVYEQLQKALDKKVWLPSGGSLIIEHTEALTVIDVNTGKNVGSRSLEDTVFKNNLEAARETARQLRLRDIGGIIVIDFVDMENRKNRAEVVRVFREELALDKTRTQVYDISDLGLVEMTRKRIGEGLLESVSTGCFTCESNGLLFDDTLFGHRQAIPGPSVSQVTKD